MTHSKRRILFPVLTALLAAAFALPGGAGAAEKFPSKNITIQIPFSGGGVANLIFRVLADMMEKDLKVPVVIVNNPGSGGAVGWALAMNYPPDGYHLVYASNSLIIQTHRTKGRIDYKKFTPLVQVNATPCAIIVHKDSGWKTLGDFLKNAKANPRKVRVGNVGAGSLFHLCALSVEKVTGATFTHVPFKGAGEAGASLLGKHIEAYAGAISDLTAALPSGKLAVLALADDKRDPFFPDVPTFAQAGHPFMLTQWRGVTVPNGTPKDKIDILERAFQKAATSPQFIAAMEKIKMPAQFSGRKEFTKSYHAAADAMMNALKEMQAPKK